MNFYLRNGPFARPICKVGGKDTILKGLENDGIQAQRFIPMKERVQRRIIAEQEAQSNRRIVVERLTLDQICEHLSFRGIAFSKYESKDYLADILRRALVNEKAY